MESNIHESNVRERKIQESILYGTKGPGSIVMDRKTLGAFVTKRKIQESILPERKIQESLFCMERKVQKPIIERKILEAFVTERKIQEYTVFFWKGRSRRLLLRTGVIRSLLL